MKIYVDLHIHSCLSPCGDEEMTPNNIVHMAKLKGLDAIAVSDHNTVGNLRAVAEVAASCGILFLPGVEVTCREEVHILAYFPDVETAEAFGAWLYEQIPPMPNSPDFFGAQVLMNAQDEAVGEELRMLAQASEVGINALEAQVRQMGGICVPAHINRPANGILGVLGMLPMDVHFPTLEVNLRAEMPEIPLEKHLILRASDAHKLENISEQEFLLEVPERSTKGVFSSISQGKKTG